MHRFGIITAISLALFPVTLSFTQAKYPDLQQASMMAPSKPLMKSIKRVMKSVEPRVQLWLKSDAIPEAKIHDVEEAPTATLTSLKMPQEKSEIPDLPDGQPVTETRFDIWLQYKFPF